MTVVPLVLAAEVTLGRQRAPQFENGAHVVPYLRSANIVDGTLDLSDVKSMNFNPREQAVFGLKPGDVLVTEGSGSRQTVGASAVWNGELSSPVCFQNTLLRLRPREGISEGHYIAWWARYAHASGLMGHVATGANILHLGAENLRSLPIRLPSLEEQRRIAGFLDVQVGRIDQIIALRERQIRLLDARFQSWLEQEFSSRHSARLPLKAFVSLITSGPRGWGEFVADSGWPFIRIANIPKHGIEIDTSNLILVDAPPGPERERTRTRAGDLVMSITAELGSVALVPPDLEDANVSQHVALLRPRSDRCCAKSSTTRTGWG